MAKRICRTADRFDPTEGSRPRGGVRRATPPSCTAVIFGEGCAGLARRQTGRDHSLPPGPGWAAPPICSELTYDRHRLLAEPVPISPEGWRSGFSQDRWAAPVPALPRPATRPIKTWTG